MKRVCLPCEIFMWNVIPSIRKEIAVILIKEHNMSQREAARALGVSEAAVSQYLKNKRGKMVKFDENDMKMLRKIAEKIKKERNERKVAKLLCRACKCIGTKILKEGAHYENLFG